MQIVYMKLWVYIDCSPGDLDDDAFQVVIIVVDMLEEERVLIQLKNY